MQPQPAATNPTEQPSGRPGGAYDDIEPGEEPGGPEQFNFREWFLEHNYDTGHPGIKSDYAPVGELLGYSPDYIERLVNGRRKPSRRVILMCRALEGVTGVEPAA